MGYVIEIKIYEDKMVYFVNDTDEKNAKEKAFKMFRKVVSMEIAVGEDENGENVYEDLDTLKKFEDYHWVDSGFCIDVIAKVDQIIG